MDLSELFTESARQVRPLARVKGLVFFFDYRAPNIDLVIDGDLMRSAIHRLLLILTESIEHGFVTLSAEAAVADTAHWVVTVTAAGNGRFAPDDALARVLQRHGVRCLDLAGPDMHVEWQESLTAQPPIDVALSLHKVQGKGLIVTWRVTLPARLIDEPVPAQAHGAQAWLVTDVPGGLDSVEYRLRHQGWHVTLLQSPHDAQALLDAGLPAGPPMLLMVVESTQTTLADLERLT